MVIKPQELNKKSVVSGKPTMKAQGYEVGTSLVDDEKIDYCKQMIEKAEKLGKKLLLPVDTTIIP